MANEQNLKPCKPGETHNPNGRPPIAPEAVGLKKFDKDSFGRLVWQTWNHTVDDLKKIVSNPKSKVMDAWLASSALKGIARGDIRSLDWFCTRLGLPKVLELVDVNLNHSVDESMKDKVIRMIAYSNLLKDPEVRKQIIDVTPQDSKQSPS